MNVLDVEQGSREWFDARLGMVTSSRVADAISFLSRKSTKGEKGDETQARKRLRFELALERLTKTPSDHYVSKWMEEGKTNEPLARTEYEQLTRCEVDLVGFAFHDRIKDAGASPDGIVGEDGLIEIKCPAPYTHMEYLLAGVVPAEYQPQMLWQMACTDRQWCDFVSHYPSQNMPRELRTFIIRFPRDDERIRAMEAQVEQFLGEVDEMVERLTNSDWLKDKLSASLAKVQAKNRYNLDLLQVP
jgi:putative phage-type endonuclease